MQNDDGKSKKVSEISRTRADIRDWLNGGKPNRKKVEAVQEETGKEVDPAFRNLILEEGKRKNRKTKREILLELAESNEKYT